MTTKLPGFVAVAVFAGFVAAVAAPDASALDRARWKMQNTYGNNTLALETSTVRLAEGIEQMSGVKFHEAGALVSSPMESEQVASAFVDLVWTTLGLRVGEFIETYDGTVLFIPADASLEASGRFPDPEAIEAPITSIVDKLRHEEELVRRHLSWLDGRIAEEGRSLRTLHMERMAVPIPDALLSVTWSTETFIACGPQQRESLIPDPYLQFQRSMEKAEQDAAAVRASQWDPPPALSDPINPTLSPPNLGNFHDHSLSRRCIELRNRDRDRTLHHLLTFHQLPPPETSPLDRRIEMKVSLLIHLRAERAQISDGLAALSAARQALEGAEEIRRSG